MRPQQKAILEAMSGGSLLLEAPFLTSADLMDCAATVSKYLGGDPARMNRNTVQSWLKAGYLSESNPKREIRNRLYSGLDLIRLATIFHVTHVGISIRAATAMADAVRTEIVEDFGQFAAEMDSTTTIRPGDFLLASTRDGGWQIEKPCTQDVLNGMLKISGLVMVFNFNLLVQFSVAALGEKWKEKAGALKEKMEAYLAKHPPKAPAKSKA
jgi:hypothetical protein